MDSDFAPRNSSLTLRKIYLQTNCPLAGARVEGFRTRGLPWHESPDIFNTSGFAPKRALLSLDTGDQHALRLL